ncbi:hypothetical protein [Guyparkeria sp.]|uniref:hypothetical protein n=1 Tax=Guyparkeria sp. TaxID=2035736 RepID=UPI003970A741
MARLAGPAALRSLRADGAGDPAAVGETCAACIGTRSLFELVIAVVDLEPEVRTLIHRIKYHEGFSVVPL